MFEINELEVSRIKDASISILDMVEKLEKTEYKPSKELAIKAILAAIMYLKSDEIRHDISDIDSLFKTYTGQD